MKFGKYLLSQQNPEFAGKYVNYERLKNLISALAEVETKEEVGMSGFGERVTSLSTTPAMPESAKFEGRDVTETDFFNMLEGEMKMIDDFVSQRASETLTRVDSLEHAVSEYSKLPAEAKSKEKSSQLKEEANKIGDEFLQLEKYANINYLGLHKILKKHDKELPIPCRRFYIMRVHGQKWVKHDYSKIFVRLSQVHSILRGDAHNKATDEAGQSFVRTTKKYWVRTENISRVKHLVLQNLPIFQHDLESLSGDSQLTNSVYFDNAQLELYHGRLDKTPGALAIRMRWYASEIPQTVFVERKTHRESWTGEISVKERFTLKESQVIPFLRGEFKVEDKIKEMKGKSQADIDNVTQLFTEIYSQIDSKQLRPTMRTRYNRTAYQIPFDATVRISLDTNLTMFTENPKVGVDCATSGRWYRDPNATFLPTEITRFPHAILEVKLSLKEGDVEPKWVSDLINSGMITEVHKFSKFIHGCATLLTESVRAVPYWVDDPSIRPSILRSQPSSNQPNKATTKPSRLERIAEDHEDHHASEDEDNNGNKPHFKFGDHSPLLLMPRKRSFGSSPQYGAMSENSPLLRTHRPASGGGSSRWSGGGFFGNIRNWFKRTSDSQQYGGDEYKERKIPMKIEPKVFLANERTMLSWLHMSVTLGSIGSIMLGVGSESSFLAGMFLLPVAVLFCVYALFTFYWRAVGIRQRQQDVPFHDVVGPTVLAIVLAFSLSCVFLIHLF